MAKRIGEEAAEDTAFDITRKENVTLHIHNLRELAKVVNRAFNSLMAFEIRLGFTITELEAACLPVLASDLHGRKRKELLSLNEAARKLGVAPQVLRQDVERRFPEPARHAGKN